MLDLHSHILPGVDDGSRTMDESVQIARMYVESGYNGVIVTPHYYEGVYDSTFARNEEIRIKLQERIVAEGLDFTLYPGNELYYDKKLAKLLKEGTVTSMNGGPFVLIEFPMTEEPLFVEELVYELQMEGYLPIFAHVERYRYVQRDITFLWPFMKKGCLMQMNLDSLLSDSERMRDTASALLDAKMIQLVGTDTHRCDWRTPDVSQALTVLRERLTPEAYEEIVVENPYKVLENRRIANHCEYESMERKPKKGFFKRLFS